MFLALLEHVLYDARSASGFRGGFAIREMFPTYVLG